MTSILPTKSPTQRDRWRYVILISLTVIIFIVLFIDARDSVAKLTPPHWPTVLLAAALTLFFPVCMAIRWAATLWAGGYKITFGEAFGATMAAWPLGTLTPSKTGDLAKAFCVRDKAPLSVGLGSVVAERATDVVVLLALSLIGGVILGKGWIVVFAGAGIVAAIAGWAIIARDWNLPVGPKWQERLANFRSVWKALAQEPQYLVLCAGASAVNWLLSIWQTQLLFRAYDCSIPFTFVCAALPVAIFVGLLPITIAGMGTRDRAIMTLFLPFAPEAISLSVGILYSICGYLLPSLVGLMFLRRITHLHSRTSQGNLKN